MDDGKRLKASRPWYPRQEEKGPLYLFSILLVSIILKQIITDLRTTYMLHFLYIRNPSMA